MKINIDLAPEAFGAHRQELFRNADFAVSTHRCTERGPMLTLANHRGALTVLPYQGLAIWDAEFDGYSLKSGRRSVKGAGRKRAGDAAFCPAGRIRTVSRCRCNACGSNWRAMSCRCTARGAGGGVGASARRCVWRRRARSSPLRCRSPTGRAAAAAAVCVPPQLRLHSRCGIPPESAGAGAVGDALGRELLCSDDLSRYVDQAEFFMLAPQGRRYVTRFATGQFNYGLRRIAVQGNRRLLALSSRRTVARMRRKERQR